MGALIRHADSGRGTFSSADRMIVRIQCAVAFGSWQFGGQAGGNDGISCQRVAGPMKSLCQGENAPVGFRLLFSLFLSVCFSHSFVTPCALSHPLAPRFNVVPSGVEEGIISGNSTGIYGCARRIVRCVLTYLNIAL